MEAPARTMSLYATNVAQRVKSGKVVEHPISAAPLTAKTGWDQGLSPLALFLTLKPTTSTQGR